MDIERDQFGGLYSPYVGSSGLKVNLNSNSNSRGSANAGLVTTKRKRRKPIKSCTFCRRRKLRCDQLKPMCSTCVARELPECVYVESAPTPHEMAGSSGNDPRDSAPNGNLLSKVNELEKQLQDVANRIGGRSVGGESIAVETPRDAAELLLGPSPSVSSTSTSTNSSDNSTVHQQDQTTQQTKRKDRHQLGAVHGAASTDSVNPLRNICYLQSKSNGRRILFGPTSLKTFFFSGHWGLIKKYRQLRDKIKMTRRQVKRERGFSMLRENELVDYPLDVFTSNQSDTSILKQLLYVLPTYEGIEKILKLFFAKPDLYGITGAFDEQKVFEDFRLSFVPGIPSLSTGERPIVNVLPFTKAHYYRIGVIICIVTLVHFDFLLPPILEKFFVFLSGLSTAKVMYIERLQFTLLRYFYRCKWGHTGADETHQLILVDSLISDAISFGLNREIRKLFGKDEDYLGSAESLEKLWCWIVFLDFVVAFRIGQPLKLNEENMFDDNFFDDYSNNFYGLLKRFLKKVGRPIIHSLFKKSEVPNLDSHCNKLLTFTEEEFLPISFYTNKELIHKTPLQETRILTVILSMLLSLNGLKFLTHSPSVLDAKNSVIKTSLVCFSLATNLMHRSIELDKVQFPDLVAPECASPPPYFTQVVSMFVPIFSRGISMPYILVYHKLTLFGDNFLILEDKGNVLDWDLSTLRVPKLKKIPTVPALSMFCEIFDSLNNGCNEEERMVHAKSHSLQIVLSMERVLRTVVQKVLECRTTTETVWKTQVQQQGLVSPEKPFSPPTMDNYGNTDLSSMSNFDVTQRPHQLSTAGANATPASSVAPIMQHTSEPNRNSTVPLRRSASNTSIDEQSALGESVSPGVGVLDQEHNIIGMIFDDFWESYNSRWAEFLDSAELNELFTDIDL